MEQAGNKFLDQTFFIVGSLEPLVYKPVKALTLVGEAHYKGIDQPTLERASKIVNEFFSNEITNNHLPAVSNELGVRFFTEKLYALAANLFEVAFINEQLNWEVKTKYAQNFLNTTSAVWEVAREDGSDKQISALNFLKLKRASMANALTWIRNYQDMSIKEIIDAEVIERGAVSLLTITA